jgi:hypothetical protein
MSLSDVAEPCQVWPGSADRYGFTQVGSDDRAGGRYASCEFEGALSQHAPRCEVRIGSHIPGSVGATLRESATMARVWTSDAGLPAKVRWLPADSSAKKGSGRVHATAFGASV